jgi:hypothetical protein
MPYFPQLNSGAAGQYPITRKNIRRTVVNTLNSGSTVSMSDSGAASVQWQLSYSHLTNGELKAISDLFEQSYGSWLSFTFLDPTDNLLNWSKNVSRSPWIVDPLIGITSGISDPLGASNAQQVTNRGQAAQQIAQILPIPGWYQYSLSVYVRATGNQQVWLCANSGDQVLRQVAAGPSWSRASLPFRLNSQSETLSVGVQMAPGSSVEMFGFQLEAQPCPGGYKKTRDRAGVYPNARLDQDTFTSVATGVDQFSCTVNVISQVAG